MHFIVLLKGILVEISQISKIVPLVEKSEQFCAGLVLFTLTAINAKILLLEK